MCFEDRKASTY